MRHGHEDVAQRYSVLCLDEFMATDVADAMVIGELFRALWRAGVVVLATSNRRPDELYNNGIQRHLFLPFVKELERRCKVVRLRSDKDYRMEIMQRNSAAAMDSRAERGPQSSRSRFFAVRARAGVAATDSNPAFERLWAAYTVGLHVERKAFVLGHGRRVPLRACEELNALRIDLLQLCGETEQPMGVADYLAIATEFDAVLVDALPVLDLADLYVMRRWSPAGEPASASAALSRDTATATITVFTLLRGAGRPEQRSSSQSWRSTSRACMGHTSSPRVCASTDVP